jgi:hypothetical protein
MPSTLSPTEFMPSPDSGTSFQLFDRHILNGVSTTFTCAMQCGLLQEIADAHRLPSKAAE